MSILAEESHERPYSMKSFQSKLDKFEEFIAFVTLQDSDISTEERRQSINDNLRYDNFCEYIRALFGTDVKTEDMKAIFRKISTNPDVKIDWSEVFGYFQTEESDTGEEVGVFTVSKRKRIGEAAGDKKRRDTIQCVTYSPEFDVYVTASQKGALSIYNGKLRLQNCIDINATTERSIVIWEHRAKVNNQSSLYVIKPLEHSPQCMCLAPPNGDHSDGVLIGDDAGYVNLLRLTVNDFSGKTNKDPKRAAQSHTLDPSTLTIPMVRRKFHTDWVLKVQYLADINRIASCSPSDKLSFVIAEYKRLFDNQPVSELPIPRGVNSFAYSEKSNVFATGGVDKLIRVWHPNILSRPTGKMSGHLFTIIAVVINEKDQHIISLSTARVFRVWDIHTLTCLQVFTDTDEKSGDRRITCIMFDLRHDRLVTGSSTLDMWPMTRTVQDTMSVPHTHDHPLTLVKMNRPYQQLISICSESVVKVWEIETSRQMYQIQEAHGLGVEVTCAAVDKSGTRMLTAAYDGSIKAWEFSSGQEIKSTIQPDSKEEDQTVWWLSYTTEEEASVDKEETSVTQEENKNEDEFLQQNETQLNRRVLAIGWNNRIREYSDNDASPTLDMVREFDGTYEWPPTPPSSPETDLESVVSEERYKKKKVLEEDPIPRKENIYYTHELTCCVMMQPDVTSPYRSLVTGCSNGNIIFWNCESGTVDDIFELNRVELPSRYDSQRRRTKDAHPYRVNSIRLLHHKVLRPDPEEVKRRKKLKKKKMQEQEEAENEENNSEEKESNSEEEDDPAEEIDIEMENEESENADDTDHSVSLDLDQEPIKMVEIKYRPVVASCHQDATVRVWSTTGNLIITLSAMSRVTSPMTSVCTDAFANYLIAGDQKGYVTMWDVSELLQSPYSDTTPANPDHAKQIICWRAHLMKIVSLAYVDSSDALITASTDGSVRVWYTRRGHYIGYFGQIRLWSLSLNPSLPTSPVLPYDINEGPLKPAMAKSGRRKPTTKKYEYPLVFDAKLWKPFRRSAYVRNGHSQPLEVTNKKFFNALVKPRADKTSLESFKPAEADSGAIFRALPVYKLQTPPPQPTVPSIDEYVGGTASWEDENSSSGRKTRGANSPPKTRSRNMAKKNISTPLANTRKKK